MKPTAESIEAEATLTRSQLVTIGADLRHHADPTILVDAAKASFKQRADHAPAFLKNNATPIGMVLLGGALGAGVTGLFSQSWNRASIAPVITATSAVGASRPPMKSRVKALLLSALSVGLGYAAGMFVPQSSAEVALLGQPKALLSEQLEAFLAQHTRGMKLAAIDVFGASRLSAAALIGLVLIAETLGAARPRSQPDAL